MEIKDSHDWKAEYEEAEDNGEAPDLADFVADVQTDAIKATLHKGRNKVNDLNIPADVKVKVLAALQYS